MNVLRMVKLFGWETRVTETIAQARENELKYIWRHKVLNLALDCVKSALMIHSLRCRIADEKYAAIVSRLPIWLSPTLYT